MLAYSEEPDLWEELKPKYQIKDSLGNGGFGQAYQAQNLKTGQQVAIKLIQNI